MKSMVIRFIVAALLGSLLVLSFRGAVLAGPWGMQDQWTVNQSGPAAYHFYIHTGYGSYSLHVNDSQGGYDQGTFYCNANDCYTDWPVYTYDGQFVYSVSIYGYNWANIYGWSGY